MTFDLSLYLVLDPDLCRDHSMIETTLAAIRGGASMVQLRDKNARTEDMIRTGRALGAGKILGLSVETEAAMRAVDPAIVDYVGVGPVFATATKPGHKPAIGLDGLKHLVGLSPLPSVAIGGLKAEHASAVSAAGAQGMAVVSAICGQPDPEAATRRLASEIWAA